MNIAYGVREGAPFVEIEYFSPSEYRKIELNPEQIKTFCDLDLAVSKADLELRVAQDSLNKFLFSIVSGKA